MSPTMMRQFWSLVDGGRANIPLSLDDTSLEQWLLRQLRSEQSLNHHETTAVSAYIHTRLPLIRDLAQQH
ncbi:MAG: hypothetical protein HC827_05460 [Cyanobacteria bacterium RM1_2_2]|nr:hypothetical protein [Cyanobacteria bacterium RM1_2_2]